MSALCTGIGFYLYFIELLFGWFWLPLGGRNDEIHILTMTEKSESPKTRFGTLDKPMSAFNIHTNMLSMHSTDSYVFGV